MMFGQEKSRNCVFRASRHSPLPILFCAAGLLYFLSLDHYYVGRFNDDARHWLAARSLCSGAYVDLAHPREIPLTHQLPGYPLLLLPAAAAGSMQAAKAASLLFLLASLLLLWNLFGEFFSAGQRTLLTGLWAFHPSTAEQSGSVMSEPAFLLFSLLILKKFQSWSPESRPEKMRPAFTLGLLCAFSAWIRPQGAVWIAAVSAYLLFVPAQGQAGASPTPPGPRSSPRPTGASGSQGTVPGAAEGAAAGRVRRAAAFAAGAFPLWLLPFLRNWWTANNPAGYFLELPPVSGEGLGAVSTVGRLFWDQLSHYPSLLFVEGFWGWPGEPPADFRVLLLTTLAAVPVFVGFLERQGWKDPVGKLLRLYVALYLCLHLFWVNRDVRYVVPILPFLFVFCLQGARSIAGRMPRSKYLLAGAAAALFGWFLIADAGVVRAARRRRLNENAPPERTLAWVREQTPGDAIFMGAYKDFIYLYSGRKALRYSSFDDPDAWYFGLLAQGVGYLWFDDYHQPINVASVRREERRRDIERLQEQAQNSGRFQLMFSDSEEAQRIFALREPPGFRLAYERLRGIMAVIDQGNLAQALEELSRLQQERAPLIRLPFYLGTTAMLLGRPGQALAPLEEAARREPAFEAASNNLRRTRDMLSGSTGEAAR
ncbi:MAG: hypothetical protein HY611_03785 [Elusimicrobia bacterium]|nr:hypothetical protein [Elusimicrobiota bacterium]